jgi:alpha-tubulin suppressor-like RCC1 family protein
MSKSPKLIGSHISLILVVVLFLVGCQSPGFRQVASFLNLSVTDSSGSRPLFEEEPEPEPLPFVSNPIAQISAGRLLSFVIDEDGALWRWGLPDGSMGMPPGHREAEPTKFFSEKVWTQVATGTRHTLMISDEGYLYSWGVNDFGVLGLGEELAQVAFRQGLNLVDNNRTWSRVEANFLNSFAIDTEGNLFAWGNPAHGQLGVGPLDSSNPAVLSIRIELADPPFDQMLVPSPTQIGTGYRWAQVSAGDQFALALTEDGRIFAFGANNLGQLGTGTTEPEVSPIQISTYSDWTWVSAGADFSYGIRNGQLYAWGNNDLGQLGLGNPSEPVLTPTRIGQKDDWTIVRANRSYDGPTGWATYVPATAAIDRAGNLYLWGSNQSGLLGSQGDMANSSFIAEPMVVTGTAGNRWVDVSMGGIHALGLRENSGLYIWGSSDDFRGAGLPVVGMGFVPISLLEFF